MRFVGAMLLGCLVLMAVAGFTQAAEEQEAVAAIEIEEPAKAVAAIEIEEPAYDFRQVSQGEVVKHDFRVFNRGSAPLEIKSVKPG